MELLESSRTVDTATTARAVGSGSLGGARKLPGAAVGRGRRLQSSSTGGAKRGAVSAVVLHTSRGFGRSSESRAERVESGNRGAASASSFHVPWELGRSSRHVSKEPRPSAGAGESLAASLLTRTKPPGSGKPSGEVVGSSLPSGARCRDLRRELAAGTAAGNLVAWEKLPGEAVDRILLHAPGAVGRREAIGKLMRDSDGVWELSPRPSLPSTSSGSLGRAPEAVGSRWRLGAWEEATDAVGSRWRLGAWEEATDAVGQATVSSATVPSEA